MFHFLKTLSGMSTDSSDVQVVLKCSRSHELVWSAWSLRSPCPPSHQASEAEPGCVKTSWY